jgi:hypothetical protein
MTNRRHASWLLAALSFFSAQALSSAQVAPLEPVAPPLQTSPVSPERAELLCQDVNCLGDAKPQVDEISCSVDVCRMTFSVEVPGRCELVAPPNFDGEYESLRWMHNQTFVCELPVNDLESRLVAQCFVPLQPIASGGCFPEEPYDEMPDGDGEIYALPLPIDRMPLRGGVELGLGVRSGAPGLSDLVISYGGFAEYIASDSFSVGLRLDYLAIDSTDSSDAAASRRRALTPSASIRWMPTSPKKDVGWRYGLRVGAGRRFISSEADHFVLDAELLVSAARLGFGVRYQRALDKDSGARDVVLLVTERTTPTFTRSRGEKAVRVGLMMHALSGGSLGDGLGPMPIGARIELPFLVGKRWLPTVAWEVLWFPGYKEPAVTSQTISAGFQTFRMDGKFGGGGSIGYGLAQGKTPRAIGSGPIASLSGYFLIEKQGLFLGLHLRAGLTDANRRLKGLFLSIGGVQIFR